MDEQAKRDKLAKEIVSLNPAIGTSLEVIRLLQKHIETKLMFLEAKESMSQAIFLGRN